MRYPRLVVSKLGQLLSYLERPGVTELVFRSGAPAVMRSANRLHPLTVTPLQVSQIQRFFEGTPVLATLSGPGDSSPTTTRMELLGTPYHVTVVRTASALEVRVSKGDQPRSTTWTDLPAVDVPVMRERRTSTGEGEAAPPASVGHLTARGHALERDSSSGMLAATPEWVIERNDDHGPELGAPVPVARVRPPSTPAGAGSRPPSGPVRVAVRPSTEPRPAPPAAATEPRPAPLAASIEPPREPPRDGTSVHPRLAALLIAARQQGASDLHLMADNPVRMRLAGALEPVGTPLAAADVEAMVAPLLRPAHAAQLQALGYADLATDIEGAGRLRVNVNRQRTGLKLCARLVAPEPPTIAALGLPPEVRRLTAHHQGLVIVSGPSGHGKTTSMAALVDMFNVDHAMHIITVEDPVEVLHPRKRAIVTQREVGSHTRSFARALAAALREDPDVIAIGELRDRETVEMALSSAETGHLVLATMSTPSGAKTIDRMIDMFPPDDQAQVRATLAGALKLVLSQRLLRRADGRGMVAAFEMITGGVPLWSLIRDSKLFQLPSLLQRGRNFGMIALDDSLRELLAQGTITEPEALVHAEDPRALAPRDKGPAAPVQSGPGWRIGRKPDR